MVNPPRTLINEENGAFLKDLSLKQSENFLMGMFGNAGNEVGLIYDDVNQKPIRVLFSSGQGHSVDLGPELFKSLEEDGYNVKNLTFTHNHPEGNPLTQTDMMTAINHNFKDIRAVGKYGKFSLSRPQGKDTWGEPDERINMVNKSGDLAYDELTRANLGKPSLQLKSKVSHSMEEELHQFVTLEKMQEKYGLNFSYQPNPNNTGDTRKPINRRDELMDKFNQEHGIEKPQPKVRNKKKEKILKSYSRDV